MQSYLKYIYIYSLYTFLQWNEIYDRYSPRERLLYIRKHLHLYQSIRLFSLFGYYYGYYYYCCIKREPPNKHPWKNPPLP